MAATLHLGSATISWLNGGDFELDGGTMFGPVPRILWKRCFPPDEENFIRLPNSPLLIRTPEANVLVDTGLGDKLTEKQKSIYRVVREWSLVEDLAGCGLSREDIDLVILTHGDFDHAGGIVMRTGEERAELTFPRARHIIQRREWEDITRPNIRSAHAYWPENFAGLEQSGRLELVDGDCEVSPGIRVELTGGHTRGHQLVLVTGSRGRVAHLGDLFPTHCHANPLWVMAYDNFPLEVIERKNTLLPAFCRQGYRFTFYHDPHMQACTLDDRGTPVAVRISATT